MTPRLQKYQTKLGALPRRHLSVIKSTDLEPVHQPEETTQWARMQSAGLVVLLCIGAAALITAAAYLGVMP